MSSKEKLKCRQVKAVLRYYVPNRYKYPEKYAHHLLFMFYPFHNEENLKSNDSGTFSEKLQESGVLDIVNRNKIRPSLNAGLHLGAFSSVHASVRLSGGLP